MSNSFPEIIVFVVAPESVRIFLQVRLPHPGFDVHVVGVDVVGADVVNVVTLVELAVLVLQTGAANNPLVLRRWSSGPLAELDPVLLVLLGERPQRVEGRGSVNPDRLPACRTSAATAAVSALARWSNCHESSSFLTPFLLYIRVAIYRRQIIPIIALRELLIEA